MQSLRVAAILLLCVVAALFGAAMVAHLQSAVHGQAGPRGADALWIWAVALVVAAAIALLVEVANIVRRFRRPEQQVRLAMQRIRAGDVGFRIARRRGEPLGRLVHECNDLLEWLNRNPPDGARIDRDVFDLEGDDA
jgi:uncharacterized membrane protein YbhN (UPF0104 family)